MIPAADAKLRNQLLAILKDYGWRDIATACVEYGDEDLADKIAALLEKERNEEAINLIFRGLKNGMIDREGFEGELEPMLDEIGWDENSIPPEIVPDGINRKMMWKTFCITGALKHGTREVYEQKIYGARGKIGGVTQKLDYLVTNDANTTSSKMKKVQELNAKAGDGKKILIIDEDELIKMLAGEEVEETEVDANVREIFFIEEVITVNRGR